MAILHPEVDMLPRWTVWLGIAVAGCPIPPQQGTDDSGQPTRPPPLDACFDTEDVVPLLESPQGTEGAARRPNAESVQLCSASAGFGPDDDTHQLAYQRFTGDVDVQTIVRSLSAQGTAGLILRTDDQAIDRARLFVGVRTEDDGQLHVITRVRLDNATPESVLEEGPTVTLPVRARIVRSGDQLQAQIAEGDEDFTTTWSASVEGHGLAKATGLIGLAQASNDGDVVATATFGPLTFEGYDTPPPDVTECPPRSQPNGSDIVLGGLNLDRVLAARVAGDPATIEAQAQETIVLRKRPGRAKVTGHVELDSEDWGTVLVPGAISIAGAPFIRGDVDGNGTVDTADVTALAEAAGGTRSVADCPEAADVDDDGDVDMDDVSILRVHLASGGPPPAAPYPDAGSPDGAYVCDREPIPSVVAVLTPDGSTLPTGTMLAEGDEILVIGADLPDPVDRWDVRFGDVRTTHVPDGGAGLPNAVLLEVGTVPTSGAKCPTWFVDEGAAAAPTNRDDAVSRFGRVGAVYELGAPAEQPELCPSFTSSGLSNLVRSTFDEDQGSLFHPIRDSAWQPGERIRFELDVPLPSVWGGPRGARSVTLVHRWVGSTYDERLERLAAGVRSLMGEEDDCDCDVDVQARPDLGGLVFEPCDPDIAEPPGPLVPDFPVRPVPTKKWTGTSWAEPPPQGTPVSCEDVGTYEDDPRQFMWCRLASEVVSDGPNGQPAWTRFYADAWLHYAPQLIPGLMFQDIGPVNVLGVDHSNLYNWPALWSAYRGRYHDSCAQAARARYCQTAEERRMPEFDPDSLVIKTFWRPFEELPESADPDDYFVHEPSQGPAQYLVGMHLNVGTGERFTYWRWATFWVPKPPGDTMNKGGHPLRYNDGCTVGTASDQPEGLAAPWSNFAMCTDDTGESKCGNPWTDNECMTLSCTECHEKSWWYGGPLFVAWFPSLLDVDAASACLAEINEARLDGVDLYESKAPPQCRD